MANKRPFESDLASERGQELYALLSRPELLGAMLDAVYVGKPPAQAIAAVVALEMGEWAQLHRSRQLIGHVVHDRLSPHCDDRGVVGRIKHPEVLTTGRTYWLTPAAVLTRVLLKSGVRAQPARATWAAVGGLLEAYAARLDPDDRGAYVDGPALRARWRVEREGRGWVASDLGDEVEFVAAPGALARSVAGAAEEAGAWRWAELAAKARRDGVIASVEEVRRAALNGGVEGGWEVGAHDPVAVVFGA
jgi:hypothetical protein